MGYYFTPTGMARIKNSDNNKGWSGCGEIRTLGLHQRREMLQQLWKTIWRSLQWLNTELPYDSAILLLGAHPREMNTCARATTETESLQQRCSQQPKGRNDPNVYHLIIADWATKGKEILIHVMMWKNLENIMLRKRSRSRKTTYCVILLIGYPQNREIYK